jgi:hypothetical protein
MLAVSFMPISCKKLHRLSVHKVCNNFRLCYVHSQG